MTMWMSIYTAVVLGIILFMLGGLLTREKRMDKSSLEQLAKNYTKLAQELMKFGDGYLHISQPTQDGAFNVAEYYLQMAKRIRTNPEMWKRLKAAEKDTRGKPPQRMPTHPPEGAKPGGPTGWYMPGKRPYCIPVPILPPAAAKTTPVDYRPRIRAVAFVGYVRGIPCSGYWCFGRGVSGYGYNMEEAYERWYTRYITTKVFSSRSPLPRLYR